MAIGIYWVGQIPASPLVITVRDQAGAAVNLDAYDSVNVKMLGTDNEEKDVSGGSVSITNAGEGRLQYNWPTTSLFDKPGEYVLQLELVGTNVKDYTSTYTLRVRQFGRSDD